MSRRSFHRRPAFSLLECVLVIVVLGVISAMIMPMINGATDAYTSAAKTRRTAERTAYAMDRAVAFLRDIPLTASPPDVDIATAGASHIETSGGYGLKLQGTDLQLCNSNNGYVTILENVSSLTIAYLSQDGSTDVSATPEDTWVVQVTIVSGGFELRSEAFLRVRGLS